MATQLEPGSLGGAGRPAPCASAAPDGPSDSLWRARRILVLGPSGSGKTYLSARLAGFLRLPLIHLDAHFWRPGWIPTPPAEWRRRVGELVRGPAWVMDGTYENTLDLRIPAADAVVQIHRPRVACLWGVFRRCVLQRGRQRADAPPGQRLGRKYLRYVWRYPRVTRRLVNRLIGQHGAGKAVITLAGRRDVEAFLSRLRNTGPRGHTGGRGSAT
jgi:adenylate kinase family enzyme